MCAGGGGASGNVAAKSRSVYIYSSRRISQVITLTALDLHERLNWWGPTSEAADSRAQHLYMLTWYTKESTSTIDRRVLLLCLTDLISNSTLLCWCWMFVLKSFSVRKEGVDYYQHWHVDPLYVCDCKYESYSAEFMELFVIFIARTSHHTYKMKQWLAERPYVLVLLKEFILYSAQWYCMCSKYVYCCSIFYAWNFFFLLLIKKLW